MNDTPKAFPWKTGDIIAATGGDLVAGAVDAEFEGVAIDSRHIAPHELFVAIVGEVHDGHTFVNSALEKGVRGVLVEKDKAGDLMAGAHAPRELTIIAVNDTTRALGDLAAFNRSRCPLKVIALTGSNGKTSTRAMLTLVAEQRYETLATMGNFNNQIGLPLTLLRLAETHALAVLELGMNKPGEIKRLAEICQPDIGMIINVAPAHLEGLGSIEGVLRAKGELLEGLNANAKAILNADDTRVAGLAKNLSAEVLLFGLSEKADVRASHIQAQGQGLLFSLMVPGATIDICLATPGKFMVSNALAAAAASYLLDIPLSEIKSGLERFQPVSGRMHIQKLKNGIHIIDDAYNANPHSVKAALDTLQQLAPQHSRIIVLGDMLELGKTSAALHHDVGRYAALAAPERLYLTGDFSGNTAQGARDGGLDADQIVIGSVQEITADLITRGRSRDTILVKGSRGMRMERIVKELVNTFGQHQGPPVAPVAYKGS
jgi:UDP-N-acetylmuramoyl-tripeptide--D-alanyl-D-alanine ligase